MHRKYSSYFFVPKAKRLACLASGRTWLRFCQVFEAKVKATGKQDLALPFTLCLQLNHTTDIILPLCA